MASKYPDESGEARPELRDRETYYAELRFAVHCQSRSTPTVPQSRTAPDDESWDDIAACFGDTWT